VIWTSAPAFIGSFDDGRWVVIALEAIGGAPPAESWDPESLTRAVSAVVELTEAVTPSPVALPREHPRLGGWIDLAADTSGVARLATVSTWAADHLSDFVVLESDGLVAAQGSSLVHFDLYPHNMLLADDRIVFVDWPHARLGASIIDLMMLLSSATADGIDPEPILATYAAAADPVAVDAILARISRGQHVVTEQYLPDGRVIRISEQPMDGGGWVATHEDFTQQQRAEQMLARTERFLATILENVTQAIVAKDAQDLRYLFVNKAAEKLYGLPRSEIIGKSARDLFSGESAELIERLDRELLAGDESVEVAVQTWETPNNGQRRVLARRFRIAGDNRESQIFLSMIEDRTDETRAA